jgi:hypothetical protein
LQHIARMNRDYLSTMINGEIDGEKIENQ